MKCVLIIYNIHAIRGNCQNQAKRITCGRRGGKLFTLGAIITSYEVDFSITYEDYRLPPIKAKREMTRTVLQARGNP